MQAFYLLGVSKLTSWYFQHFVIFASSKKTGDCVRRGDGFSIF